MPKPQHLEYENAFCHVMNRGRARQKIFYDAPCYHVFLETLAEAQHRFYGIIHAYCLIKGTSRFVHLSNKEKEKVGIQLAPTIDAVI